MIKNYLYYRNVFPLYRHIEQRKAFTPVCVSICLRDSAALVLTASQIGHLYIF